jgi:hypothetical protein
MSIREGRVRDYGHVRCPAPARVVRNYARLTRMSEGRGEDALDLCLALPDSKPGHEQ